MGKIWPVELWKAEGEIYFQSGWQAFMEYFSIGVAHFLIFRYEGDSHFHVSICDMTACEIDYPCLGEDVDESHPERVSAGEKDHSMENMDVPFGCATRRTAHTAANRAGPSCKRNRCEDYHKAGDSVKRNKPDGFGENVCKPWVFRFKRQPELVIIDSDSESSDRDDQNPGDSAEHNDSDDNEIISCKPWAFNTINYDSERDVGCTMPTQPKSASHGGNHKISKTEVKAKCPEQDAKNCATHKVDVSEREFQRAKRVIEEAKAFKSKFPTCTIIMKPSHLRKDCHVV